MGQPTRILVVNDDDVARRVTSEILRRDYLVVEASTGADALRLSHERPDLVVLDVKLPDVSGFEVCKRIKQTPETSLTPVLHLSAVHLDWRSKVTGLEGGADAYLTEPVEPPVLLAVVRALLRVRRAEKQALEAASRWQTTFDAIGDGVGLLDEGGRLTRYNGALAELLEQPQDGLFGLRCEDLLSNGAADGLFDRARSSRRREVEEVRVGARQLECVMHPVLGEGSDVVSAVVVLADVTEQRALQERVEQAQRLEAIGRLSGGVAHDFNNLLTVVQGHVATLRDSMDSSDPRRADAEQCLEAADRGARLVRQLLTFSAAQPIASRLVDLNEVVLGIDPLLRRTLGADVELVTLPADDPWPVQADPQQLETALMNLVVNAREAMPAGGTITVTIANRTASGVGGSDGVVLAVTDSGEGISAEVLPHVFEPFYTTKQGRMGLGLAIVQGILRRQAADVSVKSKQGVGTTFELAFPRAPGALRPAVRTVAATAPGGSETILLVEDDASVRRVVARTLRAAGYKVITATQGDEALRLAAERKQERIHLVLTDVVMPQMSGRELARHISVARPDSRVLLMSGYTGSELVDGELGDAAGFLHKPFTPHALLTKVRGVLDGA